MASKPNPLQYERQKFFVARASRADAAKVVRQSPPTARPQAIACAAQSAINRIKTSNPCKRKSSSHGSESFFCLVLPFFDEYSQTIHK